MTTTSRHREWFETKFVMLYPGYSKCLDCDKKHLYVAFTFPQLVLLRAGF
ncbi:MAG: hypothetical protein WA323_22255 [Candidatus Nitrosopolaris sp.]